jgi:transposase
MDRIEQRVMVNYFILKGHESKLVHKELVSTLQANVISLSIVKNWLRRFKSDKLSCGYEERPERPLIFLAPALQRFLKMFSSASVRGMARHFSVDRATIQGFLIGDCV